MITTAAEEDGERNRWKILPYLPGIWQKITINESISNTLELTCFGMSERIWLTNSQLHPVRKHLTQKSVLRESGVIY